MQRVWSVGTLRYTLPGLVILFFWLLFGDFALSMRERSADPVVQLLVKKYNASSTYQSYLLTVLPSTIALFLAPIISFKSDRHRSRWGRRIPYLLIPAPIAAGAMVGLAYSPALGEWTHGLLSPGTLSLDTCVLLWFAVFYTAFEFGSLTALVLFGALINDVVPRPFLGRFFGLFRAVSLGAGILFNRWLLGWAETHFFEIFVSIAILFGVGFSVMCFTVKEGEYPPPAPLAPDDPRAARGGIFGWLFSSLEASKVYFRESFSSSYYRLIFITFLIAGLTFAPFNRFSIPYSKSVGMSTEMYGTLIAYSFAVSLLIAYPLGSLVDRFHALRVGLVALALYALSVTYGSFFVHDSQTFAVALVAHTILSGTYFTATASLGQALFPQLKFGQFASAAGIIGNLGSIGFGMVIGPLLDWTGNNYRLTFILGLILCLTSFVLLLLVYRRFMALGGPRGYVAPDPSQTPA
jgi:MFS family permease